MIRKGRSSFEFVLLSFCFVALFNLNIVAADEKIINNIGQVSISDSISDHSDSNAAGSLANVIKQIGETVCGIELQGPKVYTLKNDLVIGKNISIRFQRGAVIFIEKDRTLKFEGVIDAGLQHIFDGPGYVKGEAQIEAVLPQWFGTVGNGYADDTVALQKAVDYACDSRVLAVNLNRGKYKVTKQLDCSNTRLPGTFQRDGLRIYGSSFWNTMIVGDTGDNTAVMDISGVEWLHLENFMVASSKNHITGQYGNNPSTVGIFVGCGKVNPQSQNQRYHVFVSMHDDMKANGGKGTIGIWNFAAEENTYDNVYIHANRPIVLTALNSADCDWEYKNSYVEQLSVHSMGMTTFTGEFLLNAIKGPAFTTVCAYSLSIQNGYIHNRKDAPVFDVSGSLMNLTYSGTIEGGGRLFRINNGGKWIDGSEMIGELIGSNVSCVFGVLEDQNEPIIELASDAKIINSDIKISCSGTPGLENRNLFGVIDSNDPKYDGGIFNSTIKTNQPSKWLAIPEVLKKNCKQTTISNHESYTDLAFPPLAK
jgi:hypothetical protein